MIVRRLKDDELYHHGIKGQRWGVRRYQNPDGSYTYAGKKRYDKGEKMDIHNGDSRTTQNVKRNYNTKIGKKPNANELVEKWVHDNPVMAATIAASAASVAVVGNRYLKRRRNAKALNQIINVIPDWVGSI